jgi:thiol-disulfide isomerase/thioredoxin
MMSRLNLSPWLGPLFITLALVLSACAASAATITSTESPTVAPSATPNPAVPTPTPIPTAPATLPTEEDPPPGASQFNTDFSKHIVPYSEILSGGPPKDGIPAIDDPKTVAVAEADAWLDPKEPVILVELGGEARAYPIQILMWHEIVNDTLGNVPVSVTFCPLCNMGIAFERAFGGQILDFGTTGRLRYSNLVMYDRQTETWWQQVTGEAIAGEYAGSRLAFVPASIVAWADFKSAHPDGTVLSRDTGHERDYGRNPYAGYDDAHQSPFAYRGPKTPDVLLPMARVVTVDLNGEAAAYPYDALKEVRVVNDTVGGMDVVVLWAPGTASALDNYNIAQGDDVGAATTFSRQLGGQTLTFALDGDRIVDDQTSTEWDVLGRAISGPRAGERLSPVVGVNHFWFSWAAFRPETRIYFPEWTAADDPADDPSPTPERAGSELPADFEISVYQGEDALGGQSVRFSELFAQGKPVVLNMWAGLCSICRAEMPDLQEAHATYGDDVLIIGIDVGPFVGLGSREDGLALLDELEITYPAGTTPDATILREYRVLGTPSTYFFKPDGEVIDRWNGLLSDAQLHSKIDELLKASDAG